VLEKKLNKVLLVKNFEPCATK